MTSERARSWFAFAVAIATIGISVPCRAQANYRLGPVGGRSEMLGGTGMAYGRDASAAFLNPATAVLVDDQRLSFSVNFYTMTLGVAPRWFAPGPIEQSQFGAVKTSNASKTVLDFDALPSSLCIFLRAADIAFLRRDTDLAKRDARFGICFATEQSDSFGFSAASTTAGGTHGTLQQGQTISQTYNRFSAGPTYAMQVTNAFAIGASFHASLASSRSLMTAGATSDTAGGVNSLFYNAARGDAFQVEGLLGATVRWGKQTFGASLLTPSAHIYGVGGVTHQTQFDGPNAETSSTTATGSYVSRTPMRIGIGSGFEGNWGQMEVDAFYSFPLGSGYTADLTGVQIDSKGGVPTSTAVDLMLHQRARGVVNFATGAEFAISQNINLLSGLSTDISAVPSGAQSDGLFNYYPAQTNRAAASFGIGSHGAGGELLLGGEFAMGWGHQLAVNSFELPPVVAPTELRTYQVLFVVAGSTSLRAIKRAVKDVTNVVNDPLTPHGTPKTETPYNPSLHNN